MAKNIYVGVANKAKKVKKIYVGIAGKARKVKKIYIGVGGIARLAYASEFEFSYTGTYNFSGNPDSDWELKLLSSGTLNITTLPTTIDIFTVGGGGGSSSLSGGGGGYNNTATNRTVSENKNYTMTVGNGGGPSSVGGTTSAFDKLVSASGGGGASGKKGGSGYANGGNYWTWGWEGSANVCDGGNSYKTAFDAGGQAYGGGGGAVEGAAVKEDYFSHSGGNGGGGRSSYTNEYFPENNYDGLPGTPNTGGGGGADFNNGVGRPGGSGIIIIRNHRG